MSVYLVAKFRVHPHKEHEFAPIGRRISEVISKRTGWELVAALVSLTGAQHECVHLWKLPDANALAMLPSVIEADDMPAVGDFMGCVDSEEFQLMSELEYSPGSA